MRTLAAALCALASACCALGAPAALADTGALSAAGCLRDLEATLAGCTIVQGLDRA